MRSIDINEKEGSFDASIETNFLEIKGKKRQDFDNEGILNYPFIIVVAL